MWKAGSRPKDVPEKWWHPWIGPFRVVRQRNSAVFEIEHMLAPGIMKVAHKNRLKQQDFRANPDPLADTQTIGIGKRVLNHREVNGKRELLIQLRINGKLTEAWIDPANIKLRRKQAHYLPPTRNSAKSATNPRVTSERGQ
jgi:hypothetical protein